MLIGTNGLGALQWPAYLALVAESVLPHQAGRAFSLIELAIGLGISVGPAIGAVLLSRVGLGDLMVLTGFVMLLSTYLRQRGLVETKEGDSSREFYRLRGVFDRNLGWFMLAAGFLFITMFMTVWGPFFAIYTYDVWHASESQINILFAAGGLAGVIFGLWGGHLSDRYGSKQVIVAASIGLSLSLLSWVLAPNMAWAIPFLLLTFIFSQVIFIAHEALLAALTVPETRSFVIGLFGTVTGLIGSLGPTWGAFLQERWSVAMPFWAALGCSLLAALFMMAVSSQRGPTVEEERATEVR